MRATRPVLSLAALAALLTGTAAAATLSEETVSFAVSAPQPAWPGMQGTLFDRTIRLAAPLNSSHRIDLIAGGIVPNPLREQQEAAALAAYRAAVIAYEAIAAQRSRVQNFLDFVYPGLLATYRVKLAAWEACRLVPFARCGGRPSAPDRPVAPRLPPLPQPPDEINLPVTIDTRTGSAIDFTVRGSAALEFHVGASLGTVDPEFDYRVTVDGPEAAAPGAFFDLDIAPSLRRGTINGTTPTFEASLDQIMTIDEGWVALTGCVIGSGCATSDRQNFDSDGRPVRTNIWTASPQGIVFFGQTLPEAMVRAGIPLLALRIEANVNLDADDPQNPFGISVNGISIPPEMTIGVAADIANALIQAPTAEVIGDVDGDSLAGSGRGDFVAMNLDVDAAAKLLGGGSIGNDLISVGFDLWDVEAGPFVDLYQDFRLWPEFWVTLRFDRPVEIEGVGQRSEWSGPPQALPRIAISGDTVVTPIFRVAPELRSQMGFQLGAGMTVDLIKAGYSIGPGEVEIGPVYNRDFELTSDQARVELFNTRFVLRGFNEEPGTPFTIRAEQ